MGTALASRAADAQLLQGFFPEGVPGYGSTAGVTVLSRVRPEYEPRGVRVGSFILRPNLTEGLGYDNNLLGTTPARGSALATTNASVQASSDWSRDSLVAFLGVQNRNIFQLPQQSQTNFTISVGGTIDVGRDHATLAASHLQLHEDPTALDNTGFDRPTPYAVNDLRAGYTANFARISLTPEIDLTTYRFGTAFLGTVPVSQGYRDRDDVQASLTTRYEFAPQRDAVLLSR